MQRETNDGAGVAFLALFRFAAVHHNPVQHRLSTTESPGDIGQVGGLRLSLFGAGVEKSNPSALIASIFKYSTSAPNIPLGSAAALVLGCFGTCRYGGLERV